MISPELAEDFHSLYDDLDTGQNNSEMKPPTMGWPRVLSEVGPDSAGTEAMTLFWVCRMLIVACCTWISSVGSRFRCHVHVVFMEGANGFSIRAASNAEKE